MSLISTCYFLNMFKRFFLPNKLIIITIINIIVLYSFSLRILRAEKIEYEYIVLYLLNSVSCII